jgi:DNA-directed RNA polymerase alpha subunit
VRQILAKILATLRNDRYAKWVKLGKTKMQNLNTPPDETECTDEDKDANAIIANKELKRDVAVRTTKPNVDTNSTSYQSKELAKDDHSIINAKLSTRSTNALRRMGILTLEDAKSFDEQYSLESIYGIGERSVFEIRKAINSV